MIRAAVGLTWNMGGTAKSLNIASIVAYVVGATTLAASTWLSATSPERNMSMRPVLIGAAVIVVAVVLQVARRDVSLPAAGATEPAGPGSLGLPLAIFAIPIIVAWAQFELRLDAVWMFPFITLLGGVWTGAVLGQRLAPRRLPGVGTLLGVGLLGIPAGLLGFWLPLQHFNTHLTDVHLLELDDDLPAEWETPSKGYTRVSAELPPFPEDELPEDATDEEELPWVEVGEPVELGTLMERGEVELRNGELYLRQPDGTMQPRSELSVDALTSSIKESSPIDPSRRREAAREANRRWTAEIEHLRRSGRIFSGP